GSRASAGSTTRFARYTAARRRRSAAAGGRICGHGGSAMADIEYFSGLPEVGIVPRAPHAGPLLQHVYEQEHGRGGFSGKGSHTYHLSPPTNWMPDEPTTVDAWAPRWESPLRPLGGIHHAPPVAPPEIPDAYRCM